MDANNNFLFHPYNFCTNSLALPGGVLTLYVCLSKSMYSAYNVMQNISQNCEPVVFAKFMQTKNVHIPCKNKNWKME